jgi:uncharacterized membrane protein (UPF0127 family)
MATHKRIVNFTRGTTVCERALLADRALVRMRGLLGRRPLAAGDGILLVPAPSIHTAFMGFPIDALFLDKDHAVVALADRLKPWRVASDRRARAVLELAAGERARRGVQVGDRLLVLDADGRDGAGASNGHTPRFARELDPSAETPPNGGIRVLLITSDRRFRNVAAMLLARRGCDVIVREHSVALADSSAREHAEVVVIDGERSLTAAARTAASADALSPPVGFVVVADDGEDGLHNLRVVEKWGSFDTLFDAVQQAHRDRASRHSLVGGARYQESL